jgi:hypothetical protein
MWSDACDGVDAAGLDRGLAGRGEFPNFAQQIFGAAGIKPAGYGGSSYGGSHQWLVWRGHSGPQKVG